MQSAASSERGRNEIHDGGVSPAKWNAHAGAGAARRSAPDSRSTVRYALHIPVNVQWIDKRGLPRETSGCTRDVGPKGAYVLASVCPPAGAAIKLTMFLPVPGGSGRPVEVETRGRVLKVDSANDAGCCSGFSVYNERVTL